MTHPMCSCTSNPAGRYSLLFNSVDVGLDLAMFWVEFAHVLVAKGRKEKALHVIQQGIQRAAFPTS